uniref:EndoU domain-containing protein n=1 Tax=Globisporangium ultimum (strain ATCC 200006 / CBS 805.95 / DAOM BR144) TaxID=431595 RepID=K3WX75_GLOUD
MANVNPTPAELHDLSLAATRLWDLDTNRLQPDVDYQIDLQDGKHMWERGDYANDRLFTYVDPCVFERKTYKLFYDLLDNYERGTGIAEDVTEEELVENNAFLNAVIDTAPMRYAYNWLVKNKKFSGDIRSFKRKLDYLWFGLYRREAHNDSSGFEHVFVGEERDGKVMGCHNWLQIYNEERQGRLDYRGYIRPKQRGRKFMEPYNYEQLATIQFSWDREIKPVSTSFIGVSPEFELALYTLCFMNGKENNHIQLGPYWCNIKCFSFGHGDRVKIGTAFPEALPLTEAQAAVKIQALLRGKRVRQQPGSFRAKTVTTTTRTTTTNAWGSDGAGAAAVTQTTTTSAWGSSGTGAAAVMRSTTTTTMATVSRADGWGPKPGQSTNAANAAEPEPAPAVTGAWAKPHKCDVGQNGKSADAKGAADRDEMKVSIKELRLDDCDTDEAGGAPSSEVVALRHGYNQTYIIRSSATNLHEVLFRCGNWCYTGKVDLGNSNVELSDLPAVIPALQKQQGSLQYLCEWKGMAPTSPYSTPLETLYDVFDFIGAELASDRMEKKLVKAADEYSWVDEDTDAKNFFELQSGGYECFDDIDLVASKTFVRGLVLLVIYYQRSFYVVLQEGDGEQPLLDVRFPDLSAHLQGIHLQTYRDDDCTNMKKLTLWQAVKAGKNQSPPKPLKVQCKDVSGTGYNQTFLIRRTPRVEGEGTTSSSSNQSLREVLFRFGNWCYNGHVDLGPKLELPDIPVTIPMLRRQQSALTFMCEVSKMPATSLFTPSMEHLTEIVPAIQGELSQAEQFIQGMTQNGFGDNAGRIDEWLKDDNIDCFFELGMDKCAALKDVEAIASKIYIGGVVLVMLYFDYTFYVYVESGEAEQPLLDTNFPDISFQKEGMQIKTYRNGVRGFTELRRLSLWKVVNEFLDDDDDGEQPVECVSTAQKKKRTNPLQADAKQSEERREEGVKSSGIDGVDAKVSKSADIQSRKTSLPHHIAPLKATAVSTLRNMPDLGLKAPWDETGKPLGLRTSK